MENQNYDDIIDLPHHVSSRHAPMSRENRAAQFAPFAALTGYDDSVKEEARLTGKRLELTEEQMRTLNVKMAYLSERLSEKPIVKITFFLADARKSGGSYVTASGSLHSIDKANGILTLADKRRIPLVDIFNVESDIFAKSLFD